MPAMLCVLILSTTTKNLHYHFVIGHYDAFVRITDIVPHTFYVVCINFIHDLKLTTNYGFIERLFMAILFAGRVFTRNLLGGCQRRNIFFLYFCLDVCTVVLTVALRLLADTLPTRLWRLRELQKLWKTVVMWRHSNPYNSSLLNHHWFKSNISYSHVHLFERPY